MMGPDCRVINPRTSSGAYQGNDPCYILGDAKMTYYIDRVIECVKHGVPFVLAGSIRDDGPLPDVITDILEAQRRMREHVHGVGFALMVATMLHSIATGNLLPAWVKVACVDINPATVTKLTDRGSVQTVGIVTDAEPFLRALVAELGL